jgi:hypothetical protein
MATIADILMEQGRLAAETARRRGERRGALVAALGQIPGAILADRQTQRAQQVELARQADADQRARAAEARAEALAQRQQTAFDTEQQERARELALTGVIERALSEPGVLRDDGSVNRALAFTVGTRLGAPPSRMAKALNDIKVAAPNLIQHDPTKALVDPVTGKEVVPAVPEMKPITFGAPTPVMSGGRRILVRAGSDGALYDMQNQRVTDVAPDVPPHAPRAPTYTWAKDKDGHDVYATPEEVRARGLRKDGNGVGPQLPDSHAAYQDPLDRAIMRVPDKRRAQIVALATRLATEGKTDQLGEVIRQAAVEGELADDQKQIRGRADSVAALDEIARALDGLKAAGVTTNILRGSVEDVARRLGDTTDARLVRLRTTIRENLIRYRQSISGAAFSAAESQEYEELNPSYRNTATLNQALVESLRDAMRRRDRTYWEQKLGADGAALVGAPGARRAPVSISSVLPPDMRPGAAAAPQSVPPVLRDVLPGQYTLSDGSVWRKTPDGAITRVP